MRRRGNIRSRRRSRQPDTVSGYMQKYLSKPEKRDRPPKPQARIGLTVTGRQAADSFDETGLKAQVLLVLNEKGSLTQNELKSTLEQRGLRVSNTLPALLRHMRQSGYIHPITQDGGVPLG